MKLKKIDVINIAISIFLGMGAFLLWDTVPESWACVILIAASILMIYQLIVMKMKHYTIFDFFTWFIPLNFLFLFGRVFIIAFGLDRYLFWDSLRNYSNISCFRAGLFSVTYLQMFFTGLNIAKNKKRIRKMSHENIRGERIAYSEPRLSAIGIAILLITLPFKFYYDYLTIIGQSANGSYVAVVDTVNGVVLALSALPVVGLITLIFCDTVSKSATKSILATYFLVGAAIMIFAGDRRQYVISLISCFVAYKEKYPFKLKTGRIIVFSLLGAVFLAVLASIRVGRLEVISSFFQFWKYFTEMLQNNNVVLETLSEFGITFYTLVAAIEFYPSRLPFLYGKSYIFGMLVVIPGLTRAFPSLALDSEISQRIKAITRQGLGGSIPQDLYVNFSLLGIIIGIFCGYLMGTIVKQKGERNIDKIRYYSTFYIMLNLVREGFSGITRQYVYAFILLWVLGHVFKKRRLNNSNR